MRVPIYLSFVKSFGDNVSFSSILPISLSCFNLLRPPVGNEVNVLKLKSLKGWQEKKVSVRKQKY